MNTDHRSKAENMLVGVFLAGVCPLLVFVAGWWTAVVVHNLVPGVSVNAIIVTALSGLAVGIILDLLLLRRWLRRFYTANLRVMAALHAALCVVAVAFFMGLPVGTFGLGILAGVYAGRRKHQASSDVAVAGRLLRRTALYAALLTAGAALPIGLLGLQERSVIELLSGVSGITPEAASGAVGVLLVCLLSVALFGAQYGCSLQAGWLAFRMGADKAGRGTALPDASGAVLGGPDVPREPPVGPNRQ